MGSIDTVFTRFQRLGKNNVDLLRAVLRFNLRVGWCDYGAIEAVNSGKLESLFVRRGGCHCGAVRFEVRTPAMLNIVECNCSICSKSGYLHVIVDAGDFKLIAGQDELSRYTFNTRTAEHLFCRICGIKSFYVPRSHPQGYSVNARCLDIVSLSDAQIDKFDGVNWQTSIGSLAS